MTRKPHLKHSKPKKDSQPLLTFWDILTPPPETQKAIKAAFAGAWDKVNANVYTYNHGHPELMNQGHSLDDIKKLIDVLDQNGEDKTFD